MDLEGTRLSEVSQAEKDKHSMITLIRGICENKTNKTEPDSQVQRTD